MAKPGTPSDVQVDGRAEQDAMATKQVAQVTVSAKVHDNDDDKCLIVVWYSRSSTFDHHQVELSSLVNSDQRADVRLKELDQDTRYWVRIWARDKNGNQSDGFNATNFWTNRSPDPPTLVTPVENEQLDVTLDVTFDWTAHDPDPSDPSSGYRMQYRAAGSVGAGTGPDQDWVLIELAPSLDITPGFQAPSSTLLPAGTFKSNQFYEWRVRTRDQQGRWGEYCLPKSFFMGGTTKAPELREPLHGQGRVLAEDIVFKWRFRDPLPNQTQTRADLRYREVDTATWITLLGDPVVPGTDHKWTLPAGTFVSPNTHIEWAVRTYNTADLVSDWSEPGDFWTAVAPGSSIVDNDPAVPVPQGTLGCGSYRVFVYDQEGKVLRGEITPLMQFQFQRKRDDISITTLTTAGFDDDCGQILKKLRSWIHELVVYRDGVRVWEGPITRIQYTKTSVTVEARDVMAYVYRRILRQGFNDSYRIVDGEQVGLPTVVNQARQIIIDALARHDPNVLGYMTTFNFKDDATTSRVVADYASTAWEVVDDMAANAGLDYTVIGRRILLWDTHRPLGRLQILRDEDFSDPPVVTEYGMQLCNYFAVTNNAGVWGAARPKREDTVNEFYGPIEMLASAYGESEGAAKQNLTREARERLINSLEEQAQRNIAHRWPTPVVVHVPENTTLSPDANLGFQQLVPGVWIPVQATGTLREVTQWQKLDSITVNATANKTEEVQVVMSPAPNSGDDPDEGQGTDDTAGGTA